MPRSPLCIFPGQTVMLPMRLAGSISHYALIAAHSAAVIDISAPYNKRDKETHRYRICDTHGPLQLTVPISIGETPVNSQSNGHSPALPPQHPDHSPRKSRLTIADIRVSTHCEWWRIHLTALESAYGRTPYFDYYIDTLLPIIYMRRDNPSLKLWRLCQAMDQRICSILGIPDPQYQPSHQLPPAPQYSHENISDIKTPIFPTPEPPYWQVRADKHGFTPGLSILDLIFSLGPEAPLYLRNHLIRP